MIMAKSKQLATVINTQFFDHTLSRQKLLEKSVDFEGNDQAAQIDKECKKIIDAGLGTAFLPDDSRFFHIAFSDYFAFRRKEEQNSLVYRIDNYHGEYTIETGLYCGVITTKYNRTGSRKDLWISHFALHLSSHP